MIGLNAIGIMQGRLSPAPRGRAQAFPWSTWEAEFDFAAAAGFQQIEWLVTAEPRINPLYDEPGRTQILRRIDQSGVVVATLCADFLIQEPILRVSPMQRDAAVARLAAVMRHARLIDVVTIVVPLLEEGAVRREAEHAEVATALTPIARLAEELGQRIAIESDLPAAALQQLLARLDQGAGTFGVCFDTGNATAAGLDGAAEIQALADSIVAIHLKDRLRGGGSVPLGEGDTDLSTCLTRLAEISYAGALVLETPVGNDAIAEAARNLSTVRRLRSPALTA